MSKPLIQLLDNEVTYTVNQPWWMPMFVVRKVLHSVTITEIKPKKIKVRSNDENN